MSNGSGCTPVPPGVGRSGRSVDRGFARLRGVVAELSGWRRALVASGLGVLAVAALPPVHVAPALVPAFVGLSWMVQARVARTGAFATGWWFGFGFFVAGLYWIANAFVVRGGIYPWVGPFAVLGLAALLAIFPGLAALLTHATRLRGIGSVLAFAAFWTLLEWVRGWIFTGFPWNLIASSWVFSDAMIQVTAVIGTYGLGLLTVAAAAMPAVLAEERPGNRQATLAIAGVLAAVWAGGALRLSLAGDSASVEGVRLRLVQPNIAQQQKWRPDLLDEHLALQLGMGVAPRSANPTHTIWAETAAPFFVGEDPFRRELIARATPADGLTILGMLRRTPPGEPFRVWNSLGAIDGNGRIVAVYDKSHLVPFGEYVPFRGVFGIAKLTAGTTDFSAGAGLTTLRLPGLPPASPLICYEIIFPGRVRDPDDRPEWILNLTNDAWYGISSGPYQHFAAARLRAVEEGLPVVRVATTGISAIVDPFGRVAGRLDLGTRGVLDGPLPAALAVPTPYGRYADWIPLGLVCVTWLAAGALRRRT